MGYGNINFNLRDMRPPPDDGVASITGLLESIETARESKRRFEMQEARQRAADEATVKHNAALEEQNRQATAAQLQIHRDTMAKEQARLGFDQQKEANAHFAEVQAPIDRGDVPTAQMNAGRYGMGVQPDQQAIEQQAEQARAQREMEGRQQRGAAVADQFSSIPAMPPAVSQAFGTNAREGVGQEPTPEEMQPTPEELHPQHPPVQINMPVGPALDYDPAGARQKQGGERGRLQQGFVDAHQQEMEQSPYAQKAGMEVANAMANEQFKGDPNAIYAARVKDLEHEAQHMEETKLRAKPVATPGAFDPKVELANNRALGAMNRRLQQWEKASGLQDLGKSKEHAETAMDAIKSGNPIGTATAIENLTSTARRGMATSPALKLVVDHMSGLVGKGESWWAGLMRGDMGEEAKQNVLNQIETAMDTINDQVFAKHQAFVAGNYTGANKNIKGNLEDWEAQTFGPLMPPGWQPDYDPNALKIEVLSGQPASPTGRGKERPAGGGGGGGAPAGAGAGPGIPTNTAPQPRGPTGGDDMRVMPAGTPLAAAAAGTGGGPGGPGDPALMTRARTRQMFEEQQARRAEKKRAKGGGGAAKKSNAEILQDLAQQILEARKGAGGSR